MLLDTFLNISPVLRILLIFVLVLLGNRFKVPLGIGLIFGGIGIDWWAGKEFLVVLGDLSQALVKPELWFLVINITLILEFGYFMTSEKNAQVIVSAAKRLGGRNGRALSLLVMPAAIGLVPMPGGALFSAPLVGEAVRDRNLSDAWKTVVNYWFRHTLEFWWPLYPVVLVTLSIFNLETWQFFAFQIPFTGVSFAAGWFFLLRPRLGELQDDNSSTDQETGGSLYRVFLPILLIVSCTLFFPFIIERILPDWSATMHKLLSMFIGLIISLVLIGWWNRGESELRLFKNFFTKKTADVVFTLGGVMIFQLMLESSALLPQAGRQLIASAVPVELIICFLPFLAGFVTGIAVGFAGPAFPLVAGLVAAAPQLSESSALVLAFCAGYIGMMLSPVHLCFLLTRRHFSAKLTSTYYYLLPCLAAVLLWGILSHLLLRYMSW